MTATEDTSIAIRALGPDDFDAFYALRLAALEANPHSFATDAESWRIARREQVLALLDDSASPSDSVIFGAFLANQLVATLGFLRASKRNVQHKANLWGFFVMPAARHQGAGRGLLQRAISRAAKLDGLRYLRAIITTVDTAAMSLCEDEGFERYGLEPGGIRSDNAGYDQAYLMRLVS